MSNALAPEFLEATQQVKKLVKTPDAATLLQLYALYKQGSEGDVQGDRPGMLDIRGRAKYDAWAAIRGTSSVDAQNRYIALVNELVGQHRH